MCKIPGPWRRRAACGETAWLIGWALGLLVLPRCSGVIVTSVRPDRGSLAGGTRLHIQVPEPSCWRSLALALPRGWTALRVYACAFRPRPCYVRVCARDVVLCVC